MQLYHSLPPSLSHSLTHSLTQNDSVLSICDPSLTPCGPNELRMIYQLIEADHIEIDGLPVAASPRAIHAAQTQQPVRTYPTHSHSGLNRSAETTTRTSPTYFLTPTWTSISGKNRNNDSQSDRSASTAQASDFTVDSDNDTSSAASNAPSTAGSTAAVVRINTGTSASSVLAQH